MTNQSPTTLEPMGAFELTPIAPAFPPVPVPAPAPEVVEKPKKSKPAKPASKISRATATKVIERYKQLSVAPESERALLAAALGSDAEPEPLAIAVLTATRASLEGVAALQRIAESTPFQASIEALALDKSIARRVWRLLHVLGAVENPNLPSRDTTYAPQIAQGAAALSPTHLAALAGIQGYLGL